MVKYLVVQPWGIGDVILTTPLLQSIYNSDTNIELHVVVNDELQSDLINCCPFIDQIHYLKRPRSPFARFIRFFSFYWKMRNYKFHTVFIGTRLSPLHAFLLKYITCVKSIVGDGKNCKHLYTHHRVPPKGEHRTRSHTALFNLYMENSIYPQIQYPPKIWIDQNAVNKGRDMLEKLGLLDKEVIAFYGGSSADGKGLSAQFTAKIIKKLANQIPNLIALVIIDPNEIVDRSAWDNTNNVCFLSTPSLQILAAVLGSTAAFISGDMGISHITAALKVPTCVIAGPTIAAETGAYGAHIITSADPLSCMPCYGTPLYGKCPKDLLCMTGISMEEIMSWYLEIRNTRTRVG